MVDLADPAADGGAVDGSGDVMTGIERVRGGAGDDVLSGDDIVNTLTGGPGVDELHGLGANDMLMAAGDGSDDTITCGAGVKDVVFADLTDIFPTTGPDACEVVK